MTIVGYVSPLSMLVCYCTVTQNINHTQRWARRGVTAFVDKVSYRYVCTAVWQTATHTLAGADTIDGGHVCRAGQRRDLRLGGVLLREIHHALLVGVPFVATAPADWSYFYDSARRSERVAKGAQGNLCQLLPQLHSKADRVQSTTNVHLPTTVNPVVINAIVVCAHCIS
jgi:hypothetical protein